MMKNLHKLLITICFGLIILFHGNANADILLSPPAGCSDAGVASASADSVCYNDLVTLTVTNYVGTVFQWQSFDGANWVDETGTGSTTDTYDVMLLETTDFRVIVTDIGCPEDTSNTVTIEVGIIPVPSAGPVTRCGPGTVNLVGSGMGTLEWYDDPTAGNLVATGSNTTAFIPASTTLYLQDQVLGGGGTAGPIQITEVNLGNNDDLEIQNVSPTPIDVTGWKVAISDSYNDINIVNGNVQVLSGILQPGDILSWNDAAASANYWGSNMFWNPGAFPTFTGWAIIIDDQNNPVDFVVWSWPDANIQSMAINIQGSPVAAQSIWTGDGIDATTVAATDGLSRVGTSDNDNASDFMILPLTIDATNPQMTLPFTGFGCNSPRIAVPVTISTSDAITINASQTNFCLSGSATLTATSNNTNYAYTWSPGTGLNMTTGSTVTCTPPGPGIITYVVLGDDGTCSNVDTVTIDVGEPTAAGNASTFQDTICLGRNTDLILTGSSGIIQWQRFDGSNWVNETGPGNNTDTYNVAPTINTTYRAFLSSGSCPPDSSNSIDIEVINIIDPTTSDTAVCGGGNVTLNAAGQGALLWYENPTGGLPVNSGTSYSFNASTTTTYYVEAFAGTDYNIGAASSALGNQNSNASVDFGLSFDVLRPITIDHVYVYPNQTGTVTINLRQTAGGTILDTYTANVTAFTGKTEIPVSFDVPVGTGYRMEVASGSVTLTYNTNGATYPFTVANGPLEITGYFNPNPNTGAAYYYLYDWQVTEGCRSNRIPATATVNAFPPIPTITQNWNNLDSSSPVGNQWYLNGNPIPGATQPFLTLTQVGNYYVSVTINGCTTNSQVFQVTVLGVEDIFAGNITIYPNPVSDQLNIDLSDIGDNIETIVISDMTGKIVYQQNASTNSLNSLVKVNTSALNQGLYIIELNTENSVIRKRFALER